MGRNYAHREARARLFMEIGHQVAYGDRKTGCFGKGGGLSNSKYFSSTMPGGEKCLHPFCHLLPLCDLDLTDSTSDNLFTSTLG